MSVKTDIRNWAVTQAKVDGVEKLRLDKATKVRYLRIHPAVARRIAREAGIPVGKRGRIKGETFEAVAKTL